MALARAVPPDFAAGILSSRDVTGRVLDLWKDASQVQASDATRPDASLQSHERVSMGAKYEHGSRRTTGWSNTSSSLLYLRMVVHSTREVPILYNHRFRGARHSKQATTFSANLENIKQESSPLHKNKVHTPQHATTSKRPFNPVGRRSRL